MKKKCLLILSLLLLFLGTQKSWADIVIDHDANTAKAGPYLLYGTGTVYWHADSLFSINDNDTVNVPIGTNTVFNMERGNFLSINFRYMFMCYSEGKERISKEESDAAIALPLSPEFAQSFYGDSVHYYDPKIDKDNAARAARFTSQVSAKVIQHKMAVYNGGEYKFQLATNDSTKMKQGSFTLNTPEQVAFFDEKGNVFNEFLSGNANNLQLKIFSGYPWIDKAAKYTGKATWKIYDNQKNLMTSGEVTLAANTAREKAEYSTVAAPSVIFTPVSDFSVEITYPDGTVTSYPFSVMENPKMPVVDLGGAVFASPQFCLKSTEEKDNFTDIFEQKDSCYVPLFENASINSAFSLYHPEYSPFNSSDVKPVSGSATITDPYGKELVNHSYANAFYNIYPEFADSCKIGEARKIEFKGSPVDKAGYYKVSYTMNVDGKEVKSKSFRVNVSRKESVTGKTNKLKNQVKVGETYTITANIHSGYPYSVKKFSSDSTATFKLLDASNNVVDTKVVKLDANPDSALLEYNKTVTWSSVLPASKDTIYHLVCVLANNKFDYQLFDIIKIEPTAIEDVKTAQPADNRIYNLMGVYMGTDINALPQGIYIMNRKKIAVK